MTTCAEMQTLGLKWFRNVFESDRYQPIDAVLLKMLSDMNRQRRLTVICKL